MRAQPQREQPWAIREEEEEEDDTPDQESLFVLSSFPFALFPQKNISKIKFTRLVF